MDINIILNNLKKQIAENGYCENLGQKELAKYKSYILIIQVSLNRGKILLYLYFIYYIKKNPNKFA